MRHKIINHLKTKIHSNNRGSTSDTKIFIITHADDYSHLNLFVIRHCLMNTLFNKTHSEETKQNNRSKRILA